MARIVNIKEQREKLRALYAKLYVKTENNYTDDDKTKLDGIESGAEVNVNADWNAESGDAQILNKPSIPDDVSDLTDTSNLIAGKKPFHGVESYSDLAFSDANKAITLSAITYWYKGVKYTTGTTITCDLDLTDDRDNSSNTLTANTLYFIYFKDATGKLYWSDSPWNFKENVFVATVFWNGINGACQVECHGHQRDLDWHMWAHDTIGTRYESGSELTAPTVSADGSLQIETGAYHDEDQEFTTGQCTTMRGWYKASSGVYTFANYSLPYVGTSGQPQWLDTDDYTLKNVGVNDFVRMWVYASLDISRPIYIIPTHRATAYNTLGEARADTNPVVIETNINSEFKLIYSFIYKGDGQLQEVADYRSSSPLPGGGIPTLAATQVSFAPTGDLASTNVQAALVELDSEKQSSLTFGIANTNAIQADAADIADNDYAKFTANGLEGRSYSEVLGDIGAQATLVSGTNIKTINSNSILGSGDLTITGTTSMPRGHIWGLTMSNAADTANDITIAAGEARDEAGTEDMTLSSAITKRIDAGWAVGTNQGGLNTGSVANSTWYEVILIKRTDTGVVDVMFSTTANRTTLPTDYTKYRRIGWVRRGTDTLLQFTQVDDHFTLTTQVNDVSASVTTSAAAVTLTAPPNSRARFRAACVSTTSVNAVGTIVFSEIVEGNVTPALGTGIASLALMDMAAANAGHFELRVSSTSQIEHDSDNAVATFDISTYGWIDLRCRLSNI